MSRDFNDPENLRKLLKASKDVKERKMLKDKLIELSKKASRKLEAILLL